MRIYIDTHEYKAPNGRVASVFPEVGIEVEIGEGYDVAALHALKDDLATMLAERLPGCLVGGRGQA